MTRNDWIQNAAKQLYAASPSLEHPLREARLLLCHALQQSYEAIYFQPETSLSPENQETADAFLVRRCAHEPLSKITQQKEFYGRLFKTTNATLDPRPDTETLIRAVSMLHSSSAAPLSFLDLGTGTGCLIITLLCLYPNACGMAVDLSADALQIAAYNSQVHQVENRLSLCQSDWFSALGSANGVFDIIVSNPPYIAHDEPLAPDVALYDPAMALFALDQGLADYRQIAQRAEEFLAPNGSIVLEIGHTQAKPVQEIFESAAFMLTHSLPDYSGHIRALIFTRS